MCFCFLLGSWLIEEVSIIFIIGKLLRITEDHHSLPSPQRKHSSQHGEAPQLPGLRVIIFVSFLSPHMKLGFRQNTYFLEKHTFSWREILESSRGLLTNYNAAKGSGQKGIEKISEGRRWPRKWCIICSPSLVPSQADTDRAAP